MTTSKTVWRWVGRAWLVMVAGIWLACGIDGDRAMMGCPSGETCDPTTPSGLHFSSDSPTDLFLASWVPVAVGGTQQVHVSGASGGSVPSAFRAVSDDPAVFSVDAVESRTIDLLGVGPGAASLRLVNDRDELYDRTTVRVAATDRLELRSLGSYEQLVDAPDISWVFMRGGRAPVVVALWSENDTRLVDTSMTFPDLPTEAGHAWDAAVVDVPATGDSLEVAVTSGGVTRTGSAPTVAEVQELVRVGGDPGDLARAPRVRVGDTTSVCLAPQHEGRMIAGVSFELEVDGPIVAEMESSGAGEPDPWTFRYGCIQVTGESEGTATLTVHVPGLDKVLPFRVVP